MTGAVICFQFIAKFQPIHHRHHNIADDEIRDFCLRYFQALSSIHRFQYGKAPFKYLTHQLAQFCIIFYY